MASIQRNGICVSQDHSNEVNTQRNNVIRQRVDAENEHFLLSKFAKFMVKVEHQSKLYRHCIACEWVCSCMRMLDKCIMGYFADEIVQWSYGSTLANTILYAYG